MVYTWPHLQYQINQGRSSDGQEGQTRSGEKETEESEGLLSAKKDTRKKTGRRMPVPEDPKDTETAEDKVLQLDQPSEGGGLLVEQPPKPVVVGDRMQAFYLKPTYSRLPKSGDVVIALAMSFPLEKAHKELLPKVIVDGYQDVSKRGRKSLTLEELPSQSVYFYLSHDDQDEVLKLPAAQLIMTSLALVERKGEGTARKVVRLSFRFQVKYEAHIAKFADTNLARQFWITMEETQGELFEDEEQD